MKGFSIKWKLLLTYVIVVAVCILVVIFVTRELSISSYSQHVQMMQGSMGAMMGNALTGDLNSAFEEALNISLVWAGLAAVVVAIVLSLVISRRITNPIEKMALATERIAEGDYGQKVEVRSNDEIGQLAESLNEMSSRLEESQKLKRELMANIAHELRTPLTSISGYMEGLVDGVVPATQETYELVHKEAARLSRLVDDLQRLSRAESGQEKLDIVELPTRPFLDRVVKKLKPQYAEKGIALNLQADSDLPSVMADEDKVDQVFVNLLDNALRYTDPGGEVNVSATSNDGMVNIDVSDTGIGMSAEDIPYIFERFYRAEKSRSRERGGSGIGLTIVKRYVDSLGGKISVKSAPGRGTTFSVRIPAGPQKRPE